MNPMPPDAPCLVQHIHVPKTAGESFRGAFFKNLGKRQVLECAPDTHPEAIADLVRKRPGRFSGVVGHCVAGLDRFLECRVRYVAFLRDPVDRVISHYRYGLQKPHHRVARWIEREDADYVDFAKRGHEVLTDLQNGQTRFLSRTERSMDPRSVPGEEELAGALATVEDPDTLIGLQSSFDASMLVIQRDLSWPHAFYRRHHINTGRKWAPVEASVRDEIRATQRLDDTLYKAAEEVFKSHLTRHGITTETVHRFRRRNRLFNKLPSAQVVRPENERLLPAHHRFTNMIKRRLIGLLQGPFRHD